MGVHWSQITMKPKLIERLLAELKSVPPTRIVGNPYCSPDCSTNLDAYLRSLCALPYSGHLLVGEAPGHRGCALTGIPFTSQRVLSSSKHAFVSDLRESLRVGGDVTEATATIVWDHLETCHTVPALWNVFPFHPHKAEKPRSNRAPTDTEVDSGRQFLALILDILCPNTIIAVGSTAKRAFARLFPEIEVLKVRHPSNGGKAEYLRGVTSSGIR
jgi:uracil-DNA glycosylase